ncbi:MULTISPECIES: aldo/keto reductase [unclassified Sphingomonas]|uniref:aldo/keto reductase n=1 Tax=unclassified Sphingomonas TaxID=196159 RepID=UPI000E75C4D9|nr:MULTISPECIES: aldo/keto reductase [unclassified Sphingomonas]RKE45929.1 aryl-alcohol dehydrogenase-like predicted oxidoreductase [Sphingomonas sp. PP-CC-1A-547]TCM06878.1 aryl-alcohol dehydrogenase-like predicted oxidoreductase [Sphingomonas sp. PP-CC-3G-468]
MDYRQLGSSGLRVPVLSFGTATFGGTGPLFGAWGRSDETEARRLVDVCLEAGVTLFDTADVYSNGASESVLGAAIRGRRDRVLISTKTGLPMGDGPQDWGASRSRLIRAVEDSLRRLGTDYVDLLQLHAFDASTPTEEVMGTLDTLIAAGKIRYAGVSNYPGWQVMKAQGIADRHGSPRLVAHQVYYSLIGRAYEADLMPVGADQGVGALVWSPLGWGRLTGKIGRDRPIPAGSRLHDTEQFAPPVEAEHLYRVIDALEAVAAETGKTVPQVAINWLLRRPTVSSVIIGARNEAQLRDNLGAVGWELTAPQVAVLDAASDMLPPYPHTPYRQQEGFARLNPALV